MKAEINNFESRSQGSLLLKFPWWSFYLLDLYWIALLLLFLYSFLFPFGLLEKLIIGAFSVGIVYLLYKTHLGIGYLLNCVMVVRIIDDQVELSTVKQSKILVPNEYQVRIQSEPESMPKFLFPPGREVVIVVIEDDVFFLSSALESFDTIKRKLTNDAK